MDIAVCDLAPIASLPAVPATRTHCDECKAPIWRSHSTPKTKKTICIPCYVAHHRDAEIQPPTTAQVLDMLGFFEGNSK